MWFLNTKSQSASNLSNEGIVLRRRLLTNTNIICHWIEFQNLELRRVESVGLIESVVRVDGRQG